MIVLESQGRSPFRDWGKTQDQRDPGSLSRLEFVKATQAHFLVQIMSQSPLLPQSRRKANAPKPKFWLYYLDKEIFLTSV